MRGTIPSDVASPGPKAEGFWKRFLECLRNSFGGVCV